MDLDVGHWASVELSAGRFSYLEAGAGPPLVFLHALGRGASDWADVISALSGDWRCLALDQRGHGGSVHKDQYQFGLMENDFREFADALTLDQFALIAHSMGGVVGLLFAEKTPERLNSLILEDTTVPMDHHEYPTIPAEPLELIDYDWEARKQLVDELRAPDPAWLAFLPRVTTPTLLLSSTQEDRDVEKTAELLPDVGIVSIDTDHWIHQNKPEEFIATVRTFLEQ